MNPVLSSLIFSVFLFIQLDPSYMHFKSRSMAWTKFTSLSQCTYGYLIDLPEVLHGRLPKHWLLTVINATNNSKEKKYCVKAVAYAIVNLPYIYFCLMTNRIYRLYAHKHACPCGLLLCSLQFSPLLLICRLAY